MAGVGARAAQIAGPQAAQLGRAQPAVAEHAQQRVVALARDRAPVGDAQEVGVVGVGERLRRPGLVPRHPHAVDRLLEAEVAGERPDHRQIHAHGRRRRRPAAATTGRGQVPAVGGDHIGVEIADHGRAAELAGQPVAEGAEDRPVLPARARASPPGRRSARPRRTGCAPRAAGGTGGGEGERAVADAAAPALVTSSPSTSSSSGRLRPAVSESCSPLTANAYSRNRPSRVTLNRPSDGSEPRSGGVGERCSGSNNGVFEPERRARGTPLRRPTLRAAVRPGAGHG